MVHYDYIREECSDSETGDYISYAIIAVRIKENDGAVTAEEICTVHDVFLNESRAISQTAPQRVVHTEGQLCIILNRSDISALLQDRLLYAARPCFSATPP